jgi:hypothetical protein
MQSGSLSSKVVNQLIKPVENYALTYLGAKLMGFSGRMENRYLGDRDTVSQLALGSAICSLATESIHNWVLPQVAAGDQIYSSASMLLNPILQASFVYAYSSLTAPGKTELYGTNLMLLAAGSEIASTYVNDGFVQPWLNR